MAGEKKIVTVSINGGEEIKFDEFIDLFMKEFIKKISDRDFLRHGKFDKFMEIIESQLALRERKAREAWEDRGLK